MKKILYVEVSRLCNKNKSSICKIVRKEKEIYASYTVPFQNVSHVTMHGKYLVTIEKALILFMYVYICVHILSLHICKLCICKLCMSNFSTF